MIKRKGELEFLSLNFCFGTGYSQRGKEKKRGVGGGGGEGTRRRWSTTNDRSRERDCWNYPARSSSRVQKTTADLKCCREGRLIFSPAALLFLSFSPSLSLFRSLSLSPSQSISPPFCLSFRKSRRSTSTHKRFRNPCCFFSSYHRARHSRGSLLIGPEVLL